VRIAVGLLAVALAVLAQVSVLPAFSIFGVAPNLVLVVLVAWIAVRGRREALLLIPAAGFFQGLLDSQPVGLAMLALAPLILLVDVPELRLVESSLVPAIAIAAAGTLAYEAVLLLTLAVTGEPVDWLASTLDVLVPAAIANALLLLPVYGLVRAASPQLQHRHAFS
jgi:rod shape-determining protein MreD